MFVPGGVLGYLEGERRDEGEYFPRFDPFFCLCLLDSRGNSIVYRSFHLVRRDDGFDGFDCVVG